jgi:LysM repeat protein
VPVGVSGAALAAAASIPRFLPPVETSVSTHVVRTGDTLSTIAAKYRTSILAIQKLNGLRGTSIVIGQRLRVPVRG